MKIHCDSNCRPCQLEGGPSCDIDDSFEAPFPLFCPTCRNGFFCKLGVGKQFFPVNKVNYLCVDCGTSLITKSIEEIAMEKARFLMDSKNLSRSSKFRPTFIPKESIKSVETLSLLYDTKSTTAFHRSLITEISRISGLTPQMVSNFARDFGISENVISTLSGDTESVLITLSSVSTKFIEILHSILLGREEGGLVLRFSVFASNIADIVFIQPARSLVESGPYDLVAYDNRGMRIWVFCVEGTIDSKDIERIVAPMLNQELSAFIGVAKIFLVAQGFSWVAKQLLRKYRGIVVTEEKDESRTIPFELWQEKVIGNKSEIIFENIRP